MMDLLRAMQTAICIAEFGSLTAAANALDCSLPTVVRTLSSLEAHLGIRLFNRTTRSMSLTEEGNYYLQRCREVLADIDEIESTLTNDSAEPSGLLTLTAPVQFGQLYVAPIVNQFVQQYPKMRIQLLLSDLVVNLVDENIDIGIRIGMLDDSTLIARQIGEVDRVVVASPDYLRRHGEPMHPKDLLNYNCIRIIRSTPFPWTFIENGRVFTVPVKGNLESNQITPILNACLSGLGLGLFMSYQVKTYVEEKKLQIVLPSFQEKGRPVNIVYPSKQHLPARTRVFAEWIKNALQESFNGI